MLVIHGLLKSMVKAKFGEIEGSAIALINGTTEREKPKPSKAERDAEDDADDADDDTDLVPTPA